MSNVPGTSGVTPPPPPYWVPPGRPPYPTHTPTGRRPGIVTAMGITSIVLASLSLIGGLIGALGTRGAYQASRRVANQASSVTAGNGATSPLLALPSPDELEAELAAGRQARAQRREWVIDLLAADRPLSPAVRAQLDGMLARHAERILPAKVLTSEVVSSGDVRAAVATAGSLPPAQAGDSDGVSVVFKDSGRLEVYGNRAVFVPADGSARLRTSGPATAAEEDAAIAAAPPALRPPDAAAQQPAGPASAARAPAVPGTAGAAVSLPGVVPGQVYPSGLTGSQVLQVVQRAQQATGGKLNPAQLAGLAGALQTQSPPLVQPGQIWSPIRLAQVAPDGSATVWCSDGMVYLDAAGTITNQMSNNLQQVTIDPVGMTLLIGESITSGLLAIFLLASGILVLRNSHRGAGLHWVYALLKLPLAVLGAVASAWVASDLMSGVGRLGGGGGRSDAMITFAIWMGVAAAIYPVVLLFVLCSRTVREFYAGERAAAGG